MSLVQKLSTSLQNLDKGQDIVVLASNGSSGSGKSWDISKDGHNGAGRHGAGLHLVPGVAASDMDSDIDQ